MPVFFWFCALVTSESDLHNICSWQSEHDLICFITKAKFPSNHQIKKIKHNGCKVKALSLNAKERHNVHKSTTLFGCSHLIHSSNIPTTYLAVALRHLSLFLSFPLCRITRVPHRHLFLLLLHKFTALSRTTTWHGTACWRDKQHLYTGSALSSKWQYFLLLARVDDWASFVLLHCEAIFVTHSIWFSHMATGSLELSSVALQRNSSLLLWY